MKKLYKAKGKIYPIFISYFSIHRSLDSYHLRHMYISNLHCWVRDVWDVLPEGTRNCVGNNPVWAGLTTLFWVVPPCLRLRFPGVRWVTMIPAWEGVTTLDWLTICGTDEEMVVMAAVVMGLPVLLASDCPKTS